MHAFSFPRNFLFLKLNLTHSKETGVTLGLPLNEASSHLKPGSPASDASQGTRDRELFGKKGKTPASETYGKNSNCVVKDRKQVTKESHLVASMRCPHSLGHLKTWSSVGGTVCGGLEGVILLEKEVC